MSITKDASGQKHIHLMVGGKRVHRRLPKGTSAGDAKRLEAQLRGVLGRKQVKIPHDPAMNTVMALYVEHAAKLRSDTTSTHHAQRIGAWTDKYTASQARECAAHIIKDMAGAYAPATINRSLATLKKGLALAWEHNLTEENYGLRIKSLPLNNKREVFLDPDQVQAIAQHCSPQAKAVIWAALLTGARRGELFLIRAEHIGQDTIEIPASHTKTLKSRVIPIVPALRPWLDQFPLTIKPEGIKSAFRRAREAAGMPHVHFHDLRHSCASILISLGVDLYTISKILGHSNVQTTQRYAHLQVAQQRTALNKLSHLVLNTDTTTPPKRKKAA